MADIVKAETVEKEGEEIGDETSEETAEEEEGIGARKKGKKGPTSSSRKLKADAPTKSPAERKKKKSPITHPRTLDMVVEALGEMRDSKGSSVQAIKTWILANYKTVRADMIKVMLKRGLSQGLDEGVLVRPKKQSETQVLSGRYRLGVKEKSERKSPVPVAAPVKTSPAKKEKKKPVVKAKIKVQPSPADKKKTAAAASKAKTKVKPKAKKKKKPAKTPKSTPKKTSAAVTTTPTAKEVIPKKKSKHHSKKTKKKGTKK